MIETAIAIPAIPNAQRLYVGVSILRAAYSAPNKLRGGAGRTRTS